jgi:hypothetical protein
MTAQANALTFPLIASSGNCAGPKPTHVNLWFSPLTAAVRTARQHSNSRVENRNLMYHTNPTLGQGRHR